MKVHQALPDRLARRIQALRNLGVSRHRGAVVLLGVVIVAGLLTWRFETASILRLAFNPGLTFVCLVFLLMIRRAQTRDAEKFDKKLDQFVRLTDGAHAEKQDATLTDEQHVRLQLSSRRSAKEKTKASTLN